MAYNEDLNPNRFQQSAFTLALYTLEYFIRCLAAWHNNKGNSKKPAQMRIQLS